MTANTPSARPPEPPRPLRPLTYPYDHLSLRGDGKIVVELKTRWRDGTSHIVLTPRQFMQRLVALVPAPRAKLTRYHGVFAPNSKWRKQITTTIEIG